MFPDRCPEGHVTLTTLLGGMLRPELASMPPDDLTRLTADELRMLLGVMGETGLYETLLLGASDSTVCSRLWKDP